MKNLWSFFAFPFPVVPAGSPGTGKSILLIYKKNTFPFPVVPGKKNENWEVNIPLFLLGF